MGQFQSVRDPLGITRLVTELNNERKERKAQPFKDLQTQFLKGRVEQQQGQLSDMAAKRQETLDLKTEFENTPDQNQELTALNFYKKRNQKKAQELTQDIWERAGDVMKVAGGKAGIDYVNERTGQSFEYLGKDGTFEKLDLGDKIVLYDGVNDKIIREFPKGTKPGSEEAVATDKTKFKNAKDLRGEIDKASKTFNDTQNAFGRVQAVTKTPSAAGDLALIFNFMKMLDPGSVVRESEFRTAEQARSWMSKTDEGAHPIPAFVKQGIQKLQTGQKLLPEQRSDFLSQSGNIFNELKGRHTETIENFVKVGERFGLEREDIVVGRGSVQANPEIVIIKAHPVHGDITESDVVTTMEASGKTRAEVIQQLKAEVQ